ncbi:MAG: hypothetical protein B7C55_13740 [Actinomycetales bacterium mxb001]|nr:MAG: hypothetical protein B7C55_13740 [Actinomycetales bacterium mxb001]
MSQATQGLDVGNVSGANYRAYMNEALKQVATMSSGATAPSNPQQQQLWFDTNNNRVKIYSGSTWIPYFGAENNTAFGWSALGVSTGSNNTAIGWLSLRDNTTGGFNTAVGVQSLLINTTGGSNTAVGIFALSASAVNNNNTAVGYRALGYSAGNNNTGIGYDTLVTCTGSNNTAIGFQAGGNITTQSNQFILGNSSITSLQCAVPLTVVSDQRDKKNIEELNFSGLEYINALTPRKYTWDMRKCIGEKKDITEIGFVAQEVESVQSTVYDIPGMVTTFDIDYTDPETGEHTITDQKMITPAVLIPVLTKAIQELSTTVQALNARIETLESALAA